MAVAREALKKIPYFAPLSDRELEQVSPRIRERTLRKSEVLFSEGEEFQALFYVCSGRVKIVKISPDGKEQILRIIGAGETFNEVPVFDGGPNPSTAQALEDSVLLSISRESMQDLVARYPAVAAAVIQTFAEKLRYLTRMVEDFSFRSVTARLAKHLLEAAAPGSPESPGARLTQQEMAAMVGTAREVVSRALKTLEARGAIRMDRNRILIADAEALRELL